MVTLQKIGSNYNYKCLTITGLSTDKKPRCRNTSVD